MSVVTYQHRSSNVTGDIADYDDTLNETASFLQSFDWITSLIVCGSYAKGSLAPGWSDLDLVVVYDGEMSRSRLDGVRLADGRKPNPDVPMGIDFVRGDTLRRNRRIVGRPLAMSLELSLYARPVFGLNPFAEIAPKQGDGLTIRAESEILVRADANSWLRRSMNGYRFADEELFDAAKTLLRIAMFESSPLPKTSYAVSDYCSAVRSVTPDPAISNALNLCEHLRINWSDRPKSDVWIQSQLAVITPVLVHYCESWTPPWTGS